MGIFRAHLAAIGCKGLKVHPCTIECLICYDITIQYGGLLFDNLLAGKCMGCVWYWHVSYYSMHTSIACIYTLLLFSDKHRATFMQDCTLCINILFEPHIWTSLIHHSHLTLSLLLLLSSSTLDLNSCLNFVNDHESVDKLQLDWQEQLQS